MLETRIVDYHEYSEKIRNIREDVFIKEQGVPRDVEVDGLDPEAIHAIVLDDNTEIGTGRMLRDGHIGRISVYHAKGFYEKLGFIEIGDVYQEAGIDHVKMKRKL
jgi:predicted GNAT family N-acyltransferase